MHPENYYFEIERFDSFRVTYIFIYLYFIPNKSDNLSVVQPPISMASLYLSNNTCSKPFSRKLSSTAEKKLRNCGRTFDPSGRAVIAAALSHPARGFDRFAEIFRAVRAAIALARALLAPTARVTPTYRCSTRDTANDGWKNMGDFVKGSFKIFSIYLDAYLKLLKFMV